MVKKYYDVAVVGSGPAGISAALAAARSGAKTLIIEKQAYLGGMMTSGLVTGFHGMRVHEGHYSAGPGGHLMTDKHTPLVVKGISLELCNRLKEAGGAYTDINDPPMRVEFDPEVMIPLLFRMCMESGVDILVDSFVFGLEMNDGKIDFVKVANKSGEVHVYAKVFVDASADGDLIEWSGAAFNMGTDDTHRCMPLTVYMVLGNVHIQKLLDYYKDNPDDLDIGRIDKWQEMYDQGLPISLMGLHKLLVKAGCQNDYPAPLGCEYDIAIPIFDIQTSMLPQNTCKLLVDMAYGIDLTNGDDVSKAEMDIRMNQLPGILKFMRKYVPGFKDCHIVYSASALGTRESRRLEGEYVLSREDILTNARFEDSIGVTGRAMNVHSTGGGAQNEISGGRKWTEAPTPIGTEIPYRSIVPKTVKNLLVSGRCMSVDRDALGSIRGEPVCMVSGEAAGTAAAMAAQKAIPVQDIPIKELQDILVSKNVVISL